MMLLDVLLFHMLYFFLYYSAQARLQTYTPAQAYENMAIEKLKIIKLVEGVCRFPVQIYVVI